MKTPASFAKMKATGRKIAALTAYDATFAAALHEAGCDTALVGDSLGMVIQGRSTTHSVSLEDVIYHLKCARRGAPELHLMADLPFGSFENGEKQAFESAARLFAAGAQMVKIEGGGEVAGTIEYLVSRGLPVCGHVGLLPQKAHASGLRVQGKKQEDANLIFNDAKKVSEAGASLVVLEMIPAQLAKKITAEISAATIGIGAGKNCDGQILVLHDVLGVFPKAPTFAKDFLADSGSISHALRAYVDAVRKGGFPSKEHTKA